LLIERLGPALSTNQSPVLSDDGDDDQAKGIQTRTLWTYKKHPRAVMWLEEPEAQGIGIVFGELVGSDVVIRPCRNCTDSSAADHTPK
jgi:hypothetical protein